MALTDPQTSFADSLVGGRYQTEGLDGEVTAWFEHGQDEIVLVCKGPNGPFTALQPVPVEEEEQDRRRFSAEALTVEQEKQAELEADARREAAQAAAAAEFEIQLAAFTGIDPQDKTAMDALRKRLAGS